MNRKDGEAFDEPISVQTVTLEKVRLSVEAAISNQMLIEARVDYLSDWIANRARVQVSGYLWGKTIERHRVSYPADWWQAVKDRWFPYWALDRWPVRYKEIDLSLQAIWPTLRMMVPKHEPRLVLTSFGSALGGYSEKSRA